MEFLQKFIEKFYRMNSILKHSVGVESFKRTGTFQILRCIIFQLYMEIFKRDDENCFFFEEVIKN